MKVLLINASPRKGGNSSILIDNMINVFKEYDVETEVVEIGGKDIRGCSACGYCHKEGKCVYSDLVNDTNEAFKASDGLVLVAPVYYGSPNGTIISFLDRLFYSSNFSKKMKVGAAFAVARRGGTTASFDVLNKYFTIAGMPVASGDYWNNAFGRQVGEVKEDKEGLRNARVVAKRMIFLMKAIKDAKDKYPSLLEDEERVSTNFIK
ncbi:MAG: flavodoxin family protein [Bacilli bacterium]|nr:flavodoxin family protein [Bacilli bacterium]